MITQLKFTAITKTIRDPITGEDIHNGYKLLIPFEVFEKCNFSTKIKLYCPTCDFLKTPVILHAWAITKNAEIVNKVTHMNSIEWANVMNFKQPTAIYWPSIQESDIAFFEYNTLFILQPLIHSEIHEFFLELESDK